MQVLASLIWKAGKDLWRTTLSVSSFYDQIHCFTGLFVSRNGLNSRQQIVGPLQAEIQSFLMQVKFFMFWVFFDKDGGTGATNAWPGKYKRALFTVAVSISFWHLWCTLAGWWVFVSLSKSWWLLACVIFLIGALDLKDELNKVRKLCVVNAPFCQMNLLRFECFKIRKL